MDAIAVTEVGRWLFVGAMVFLAVHDVITFRIPNWANASIAIAFLAFAGAATLAGAEVWWLGHLAAAAILFAVGLVLFQTRALGGGDVKLLAVASLWVGLNGLPTFLIWVGLAGGVLVLLLLLLRRNLIMLVAWASPQESEAWPRILNARVLTAGEKVPYGVAIAIGSILTVLGGERNLFG